MRDRKEFAYWPGLEGFQDVWCVTCNAVQSSGEPPQPVSLVARECLSGRLLHLSQDQLQQPAPPWGLGSEALVVLYGAPAVLGCFLALGWSLPNRVLDLHAEFRCLT